MSTDELRFVNAFIGFCTPMGGTWPDPFVKLAYQPVGVEMEVATFVGGNAREVVPELICASSTVNHAFLLEAKSATVSDRQAKAYEAVTPNDLVTQGIMPPEVDVHELTLDSIYICATVNAERMMNELAVAGVSLSLVAGDEERFATVEGQVKQPEVNSILEEGIMVHGYQWPTHFVTMNSRATEAAMSPIVVAAAVPFITHGDDFNAEKVAERGVGHWAICGRREKQMFRTKITNILGEAALEELSPYIKRIHPHQAWQCLAGRRLSTRAHDGLRDRAEEYVFRKQRGIPYKKDQPRLITDFEPT